MYPYDRPNYNCLNPKWVKMCFRSILTLIILQDRKNHSIMFHIGSQIFWLRSMKIIIKLWGGRKLGGRRELWWGGKRRRERVGMFKKWERVGPMIISVWFITKWLRWNSKIAVWGSNYIIWERHFWSTSKANEIKIDHNLL